MTFGNFPHPVDEVIGTKWNVPILRILLAGPTRFSRLRQAIPGLSSNLLSSRLKKLETMGVVERAMLPEPANREIYRLTSLGNNLHIIIEAMNAVASMWNCLPPASHNDEQSYNS